jgi:restriction endonuclease S subunit
MRVASINIKSIKKGKCRFEGKHFLNTNSFLSMSLESNFNRCLMLEDIAQVFNPPVFKRQFCMKVQNSVGYFQSSDILSAAEDSNIFINKAQAISLNLLVKKNDILVTGFGTIGDTRLVSKYQDGSSYANNVCRIRVKDIIPYGYIYAFLSSKYGIAQLNKNASGSVVRYIEAPGIKKTLIPNFSDDLKKEINELICDSVSLREEATSDLKEAERLLKIKSGLRELTTDDFDYFGHRNSQRKISCFTRNIQEIGTTTINAFNHSERIRRLKASITCPVISLKDALKEGRTYGTSGLPNIEVKPGHGIMLINQKDMFDNIVKGKWISSKGSDPENVLEYGEILIACDGTLGENELFCRAVFANEDLKGSYVSSHFLRLKVNDKIPAGYLYCWINSDYGFRFIRNTQAGTKLCHPINKLFLEIPVPLIEKDEMLEIDRLVREAHTKRHQANQKELKAISMVEQEIEKWNN